MPTELDRLNIIELLKLWSSKEQQLDYQNNVHIAEVSAELFCQWDEAFLSNDSIFMKSFSKNEFCYLQEFNKLLNKISDRTSR